MARIISLCRQAAFRLAAAAVKLATGDPEEACPFQSRAARASVLVRCGAGSRYLTYCDLCSQFPPVEGDAAWLPAQLDRAEDKRLERCKDSGSGSVLLQTGKAEPGLRKRRCSSFSASGLGEHAARHVLRGRRGVPNARPSVSRLQRTRLGVLQDLQRALAVAPTDPDVLVAPAMLGSWKSSGRLYLWRLLLPGEHVLLHDALRQEGELLPLGQLRILCTPVNARTSSSSITPSWSRPNT